MADAIPYVEKRADASAVAVPAAIPRPPSCTSVWITLVGLVSLLIAAPLLRYTQLPLVHQGLLAMVAATGPIIVLEILVLKVHRRASAGLIWDEPRPIAWGRSILKLFGFAATLICVGIAYWAFREYAGAFYEPFWQLIRFYGPWAALVAIPYFVFVDSRMREPRDGYWHFAMAVLGRYDEVSKPILAEHVRGWVIKAFFLPLMFVFVTQYMAALPKLTDAVLAKPDLVNVFEFAFNLTFLVDTAFATVGYILMFRLIDAHLRWAEPTALGWLAALVCYPPFWSYMYLHYLNYETGFVWGQWLEGVPVLKAIWGGAILLLLAIYSWATVQFGCRFSNLTHRGILTNGPYRFTKHPAYITKNLSWWLISIPFVTHQGLLPSLKACLLLGMINAIYFIRAKTEERHLMRDPVYAAYAAYIDRHGMFRWVERAFPLLRYRPPPLSSAA